jgi:hypothetical protein
MYTLEEQIAEVQREIALRKACYPAWVKKGTLDPTDAKRQIALMQEVLKTLRLVDVAQRQLPLFPGCDASTP